MQTRGTTYEGMAHIISQDPTVRALKKNTGVLEGIIASNKSTRTHHIRSLIVQHGLGVDDINSQMGISEIRLVGRNKVGTLTIEEGDTTVPLYFSRQIGMWIKGEPTFRGGEAYCQITKKKIPTDSNTSSYNDPAF